MVKYLGIFSQYSKVFKIMVNYFTKYDLVTFFKFYLGLSKMLCLESKRVMVAMVTILNMPRSLNEQE